jgi:hypothetical protein
MSVSLVKDYVEITEVEAPYCDAEVRGATRWDQAEYCEDEATVKGADGGWYCGVHDPARMDEIDPDEGRDMERDYWLDDMGE